MPVRPDAPTSRPRAGGTTDAVACAAPVTDRSAGSPCSHAQRRHERIDPAGRAARSRGRRGIAGDTFLRSPVSHCPGPVPPALHHAGDVDFSDHAVFDDLGRRFRLDATLLPIGGMLPVWYYRARRRALDRGVHIDPDAALAIAERLGAGAMVPVHWGTLNLRLGPPSMPRRRLVKVAAERGVAALVRVLGHGQRLAGAPGGSQVVGDGAADTQGADRQPDQRPEDPVADHRV